MKCLVVHNRRLSGPKVSSWFTFFNIHRGLKDKDYLLGNYSTDFDLTDDDGGSINDEIWNKMDCLFTVFSKCEAPLTIASVRGIPSFLEINYACSEIACAFITSQVKKLGFFEDELKYEQDSLGKELYDLPTYVIGAGNQYTENTYRKFGVDNVKMFRAGIDYSHFSPRFKKRGSGKIRFTFTAAALNFRKGFQYVAEAWQALPKRYHKNIELHLFGNTPYAKKTSELFDSLMSKHNNVYWHGFASNQSESYIYEHAISDCMLCPTLAEGQSGTALEGLSFGLYPVISPYSGLDLDGIPAYALDTDPSEWVEQLVEAVKYVVNSYDEVKRQMPVIRKETVKQYTWRNYRKSVISFMESVVN